MKRTIFLAIFLTYCWLFTQAQDCVYLGATLLNPASCELNDGSIQLINVLDELVEAYTLTQDNSGAAVEVGTEHTFTGLAPGSYTLEATGSGGCVKTLSLRVPVDSSACEGWAPSECRTQFGMNLNFPSYWTTERPFKNLFLFNGGFYSTFQETPWIPSEQYEAMPKDDEGYPTQIPWTDDSGVSHIVKVVVSSDGYYPNETLVVLYDGQGDIRSSAPMSNITPGRFEIVADGPNQILLDLFESQAGDHIRNIRVLRREDEFADLNANPFHQTFLDRLSPFRSIRFMNWMNTNNSEMSAWSQRTLPNNYNQGSGNISGVAYEYLIQLCNRLQSDPWICIPHQADDDYVRQLARFFRDNLDNSLTIYLEYSNEVWNWQFTQSHWVTDNGPANLTYPRRYAERATQTMQTFTDEFGEQADRVKRVLGAQLTNNWLSDEILSQANPEDYDYISPSAYFGFSGGDCEAALNSSSTAMDVIDCTRQTFYQAYASIRRDYWNAKMYGKEVVNYEAGNHMTNFNPDVPFADALREAQTHPAIYDLYQEVIDSLRILDSRLVMFFVLASRLGNTVDVFGHLDHIDQPEPFDVSAPKYQALLDNIAEPCTDQPTDCHPDLSALRAFYEATGGDGWINNTGWLENCDPCSETTPWHGVACLENRVTTIALRDNNLTGSLPETLGELTRLTLLRLTANELSGAIPAAITNCRELEVLYLEENELTGNLPEGLLALPALRDLRIQNNQLSGGLADEIPVESPLRYLLASSNFLSGPIPSTIGNAEHLTLLYLHKNNFSGVIPRSISNCLRLSRLYLSENELRGRLPRGLLAISTLLDFRVHNNQLSGNLPDEIPTGTRLRYFLASDNQFSGSIPETIGNAADLTTLYLQNNRLTGSIPASIIHLSKLDILNLYDNRLSGSIPEGLLSLPALAHLRMQRNQLSGTIPDEIPAASPLISLLLSSNRLSGSIPATFGLTAHLRNVYLDNNELSGCFPVSLNNLCSRSGASVSFANNPDLPGGGNFTAFCNSGVGACANDPGSARKISAISGTNSGFGLQWRVYPNPARDQIRIELPAAGDLPKRILVYNWSGQVVREIDGSEQSVLQIDVSELPVGTYALSLQFANRVSTKKVVISR